MKYDLPANVDLIYSGDRLNCAVLNSEFDQLLSLQLQINFYDFVLKETQQRAYKNHREIDCMFNEWSFKIHSRIPTIEVQNGLQRIFLLSTGFEQEIA